MSNFEILNKNDHGHLFWQRTEGYKFTAEDTVCPLVASEVINACTCLPLAFTLQDKAFLPVAVQGLQPEKNLLVLSDNSWYANYIPAAYRAFPFVLAEQNDEGVLCIHSDYLSNVETDISERIFDLSGGPSKSTEQIINFLATISRSQKVTRTLCNQLNEMKLITTWEIKLASETKEHELKGLHKIDEEALRNLSPEDLASLRDSGALSLAYCQLISMQNIRSLIELFKSSTSNQNAVLPAELDLEYLNNSDSLDFNNV